VQLLPECLEISQPAEDSKNLAALVYDSGIFYLKPEEPESL